MIIVLKIYCGTLVPHLYCKLHPFFRKICLGFCFVVLEKVGAVVKIISSRTSLPFLETKHLEIESDSVFCTAVQCYGVSKG